MSSFHLPTDLLNEVLLKLPLKSLIRFTSVSKSWQSLITSPTFLTTENHVILEHFDEHQYRKRYLLLKVTEKGLDSFSELEFPSKIPFCRIVASCHGLVCLSDYWRHVIIWNPYVKSYVVTPNFVFNRKKTPNFVLGFGVVDDVYKVVRLVYDRDPETVPPVAEIFCSRIGRWRRVEAFDVRLQIIVFRPHQVFLKGVVHWPAFERTVDNGDRSSILTFEVGDEVFGEVMLPDELAKTYIRRLSLFMIGESLGVIKVGNGQCDVWMMNEYGVKESWTELYTIDFGYQLYKVVGFCTSGEALFAIVADELVAYIPQAERIMNLGIYGDYSSFSIDNYVESLVLLRGYSRVAEESSCPLDIN